MSKPVMSYNTGVFTYVWEEEQVGIKIDRLSEDSRGNLTGEILVRSGLPGSDKHVHMGKLNLTSTQARDRLAKTLEKRIDSLDWYSILEQACVLTLSRYREGEPIEAIGHEPDSMELKYRLHPLLEEGEPTIIFAPGGSGKSYLADYIAVLVQYNYPGVRDWIPETGNVLYLDWEASKGVHQRRIWAIKTGLGITDGTPILYRFCSQPLVTDIIEIQRHVLESEAKLVIIDSQIAACSGDVEKAETASSYFNALRSLRCTTLTLDHVPKNSEGGKMPYGSVVKWNRARSIFELRNQQEPGENTMELGLYHRKHNEGRLLKPIGIRVQFEYGSSETLEKVIFGGCDIRDIPELSKGLSLKEQIVGFLKSGALSIEELAEELDTSQASVKTTLYRHKDVFVRVDKKWGLLSNDVL